VSDAGRTISILEGAPDPPRRGPGQPAAGQRPWIGVRFLCAGAYVRVGRNPDATAYHAVCPRCGKRLRFRVGPGGTEQRFFEVSC
jgi:hypothetical protein